MEIKKNPTIDLRNKRSLFLAAGYVVATAFSLAAFEWKTFYELPIGPTPKGDVFEIDVEDEIEMTYAKPDPPKQKVEINKLLPPVIDNRIVETKLEPIVEPNISIPEIDVDFKVDPISFPPIIEEKEEHDGPWVSVEKMPKFPGGELGLLQFVMEEIRYPAIAKENGISGVVYVYYVVDEDGNVVDVSLRRGVDPFLDREALRAVKTITGYTAGEQRGKPVKVQFTLPIRFELK
ncbi:MAG: protein TonB [Bacteroidia bacterium]|jgi:protein TonB